MGGRTARLEVRCSRAALAQISEARANAAKNPNGARATFWRGLERILADWLTDPQIALRHDRGLKGDLANVFRIKMGRARIF